MQNFSPADRNPSPNADIDVNLHGRKKKKHSQFVFLLEWSPLVDAVGATEQLGKVEKRLSLLSSTSASMVDFCFHWCDNVDATLNSTTNLHLLRSKLQWPWMKYLIFWEYVCATNAKKKTKKFYVCTQNGNDTFWWDCLSGTVCKLTGFCLSCDITF